MEILKILVFGECICAVWCWAPQQFHILVDTLAYSPFQETFKLFFRNQVLQIMVWYESLASIFRASKFHFLILDFGFEELGQTFFVENVFAAGEGYRFLESFFRFKILTADFARKVNLM